MFAVSPAHLLPGFETSLLGWLGRVPVKDPADFLYHLNNFVRHAEGRMGGVDWLSGCPEFLILCSSNDRSGLTGFKGLVKEDEVERIGTPVHVPLFGFKRSEAPDAEIDTFLRLNLTPQQVPGLTNYSMALGHYIFTNYFGLYNESGVTGTAGKLSLSDRASSGFRPSFFLNSTALLYGSIQQWGFHLGYRNDDLAATCWREDAKFPLQSIITGNQLADSKLTLLSSEPGNVNSANGMSFWWVGGGAPWTDQKAVQCRVDMIRFLVDIGVYEDIEVPSPTPGANCFGPESLQGIVPSGMRMFTRTRFPPTNSTPASAYSGWPVTDSLSTIFTGGTLVTSGATDPITTEAGSDLAWLSEPVKFETWGQYWGLSLIGFTGGNGLTAAQINGRRLVVGIDEPGKRYRVKLGGVASAAGAIGGSAGEATYQVQRPYTPKADATLLERFTPPRGGRLANFIPIYRSNGADVVASGATLNSKGSATTPTFRRATDLAGTSIKAGTQCIFLYSTYAKSIYAFLVYVAQNAGYAARNELRDPLAQPSSRAKANVGNGTLTALVSAAPANGLYSVTLQNALDFIVTGPTGAVVGNGTVGTPFSQGGTSFRINAGTVPFVAGDGFWLTLKNKQQGYLDIAEEGGFAEADVQFWHWWYTYADQWFTVPSGVQAGVWDKCIVNPITMAHMNWGIQHLAQWWDCEQQDNTPPTLNEWRYQRWDQICGAVGIKWQNWGHELDEKRAKGNGFNRDNIPRIVRLPNCDGFLIPCVHDNKPGGPDVIDRANEQWDFCSGPDGSNPPPADRIIIRTNMSAGRYYVTDPTPLGQFQIPIAKCAELATWMAGKGIAKFGTNNNGASPGGTDDRYYNQQLIALLPALGSSPPPVPDQPGPVVEAWANSVGGIGGTISEDRYNLVLNAVDVLMLQGLWPKIRYLGLFAGENQQQVLIDIRQRLTGIMGAATAAPAFTANRGLTFDGVNDDYRTGFIPLTHGGSMTVDQMMMAIYLRLPGPAATGAAQMHMGIGATGVAGAQGSMRFVTRGTTGGVTTAMLCNSINIASGVIVDNSGLTVVQRDGAAVTVWRNGGLVGTGVAAVPGAALPDWPMRVGNQGNNTGGIAGGSYIQCDPALVAIGLPLTAAEHAAFHATVHKLLSDIGAQSGPPTRDWLF